MSSIFLLLSLWIEASGYFAIFNTLSNVVCLSLKFHRVPRFPLPTSRFTLLCSTDSHHAHNRRHLCKIFSYNHPSFSVHVSAKTEQANFPNSRLFTREAGSVRWELVWDIFEQNTSNHFSVHVGSVKCEV